MKTFEQRLNDYVLSHPGFHPETVYDYVYQEHKKAIWKLQHRIKERLIPMLTSNASVLFLTLTFDDAHLPTKENEQQTESYVNDFFNSHPWVISYVANTDYGKENGRFHWHAVVLTEKNLSFEPWIYGTVDFERVRKSSVPLRLSRYLVMLKHHAVKVLNPQMIYYPKHYKNIKGGE